MKIMEPVPIYRPTVKSCRRMYKPKWFGKYPQGLTILRVGEKIENFITTPNKTQQ